jgi:hypothetical protein
MRKKVFSIGSIISLVGMGALLVAPNVAEANSFFWQGTDISDSGPVGLLDYSKQREVHDALLNALPVILYPDTPPIFGGGFLPLPPSYTPALDGLPNPDGGVGSNGNLNRMYRGTLMGAGDPNGLRIYESDKTWDGYTLINAFAGPPGHGNNVLIDMNGNIVNSWIFPGPAFQTAAKSLKDGNVIASTGGNLVQLDWCSNEVKRFEGLNNHHDHQREPSTVGYYYPGGAAWTDRGKSLSLGTLVVGPPGVPGVDVVEDTLHIVDVKRFDPGRPDRAIVDDVIREIPWDWDGTNAEFEWHARDHFYPAGPGDLGFGMDEAAEYALDLGLNSGGPFNQWNNVGFGNQEDWTHGNSVAWLGENKWYSDFVDERFHPDNIIADFRSLNVTIIIARYNNPGKWDAGDIVWRLGPNYGTDGEDGQDGQIIGQHMAHMIPDALPGGGNIMIFDNGGGAGYGALIEGLEDPGAGEKLGFWPNKYRTFSRVLEINPVTKQIVWQHVQAKPTTGDALGNNHLFFSNIMAGAQRLPNGNTFITEADTGRLFEITMDGEVVWEFAPGSSSSWPAGGFLGGAVYRAYRVPHQWVPKNGLKDRNGNGTYDMCE